MAPRRPARAQAERVRRLPRRRRLARRRRAHVRDRLAILGGSNGGLLVGAALTQRPDLCRAVWCAVPLLDMVRFPQFLIARLWTDEYGDPDVAEEFAWLHAYSPYHHVVDGDVLPGGAVHDRRGRHPGRPAARPQDGGAAAGRVAVPGRAPDPAATRRAGPATASASRSQAGRRAGRRPRVLHLAARRGRGRDALVEVRVAAEPDGMASGRGAPRRRRPVGRLGSVLLRVDPTLGPPGLAVVACSTSKRAHASPTSTDCRRTRARRRPRRPPVHDSVLGVTGIDHVVVVTPDLDRTVAAVEEAPGPPCCASVRVKAGGSPVRQAFFRLGEVILEVVSGGSPGSDPGAARLLYGLAVTVNRSRRRRRATRRPARRP